MRSEALPIATDEPHAPAEQSQQPEFAISPQPAQWADLVRSSYDASRSPRIRRFREQLGLPLDRPIIMTGHQANFWHAGILAKYLVCDAASRAMNSAPAWVVVDQDEHDFTTVRVPTLDESGRRRVETLNLLRPSDRPALGLAAASCPAFDPIEPTPQRRLAAPSVARGLRGAVAALAAHRTESNAARQFAAALGDLMAPLVSPASTIFATELAATDLFSELLASMSSDPRRVADTYNQAIQVVPDAGLTPLAMGDSASGPDLPLWRLLPGEPRRRVHAGSLESTPRRELAPRALLLTALLRLAGCDLFIHGTGGAVYDNATERWMQNWLGETLSAKASVTATLRLPMEGASVSSVDVRQAAWFAHSARHNPDLLGDVSGSAVKRRLVAEIEVLREMGTDARPAFFKMHELLKGYAARHAAQLAAADAESKALEQEWLRGDPALDRTWPFAWHSQSALIALRDTARTRFRQVS